MDRTLETRGFRLGGVFHNARLIKSAAGGKGINVSRALKLLGCDTLALTVLGGGTGRLIAEKLAAEGIDARGVEIRGESRVCLDIIDSEAASETVLNETGPEVLKSEASRFMRLFNETLDECENPLVVLAGSAPPGFGRDVYGRLVSAARRRKAKVVVDAGGDLLRAALASAPFAVKINAAELEGLFSGKRLKKTPAAIFDAMERAAAGGAEAVVVTRGAKDALALVRGPKGVIGRWSAGAPPVAAVSAWGAGDCMTAGLVLELAARGCSLDEAAVKEALMMGMAAGAANTLSAGAGALNPRDVKRLLKDVRVKRLPRP
jgi:1-phosphofructokinase family hexose kinase